MWARLLRPPPHIPRKQRSGAKCPSRRSCSRPGQRSSQSPQSRRGQGPRLLPLALMALLAPLPSLGEITMSLSQAGLDNIAGFSLDKAMSGVANGKPSQSALLSRASPKLEPVAAVRIRSLIHIQRLRLILRQDSLGVMVQEASLRSVGNVSAAAWPLPAWPLFGHVGEERLHLNVSLPQVYIGIKSSDSMGRVGNTARLSVSSCTVTDPGLSTSADNYWLLGLALKAGAAWMRGQLPTLMCDQIRKMLEEVLSTKTSSEVDISAMLAAKANAPDIFGSIARNNVKLHYNLASLRIREGRLAATVTLAWTGTHSPTSQLLNDFQNLTLLTLPDPQYSALRDPMGPSPEAEALTDVLLKLNDENELSLWIHLDFLNDLFLLMDFNSQLSEDTVPVTSEKIPLRPRKFFSVLCSDCYFQLKAFAHGPPRLAILNSTLHVSAFIKATLWVYNPHSSASSPFIEFLAMMGVEMRPAAEDGTLRLPIELRSVHINMRNSAFPPDWDGFVQDLVAGMIQGMMWPKIQAKVENVTVAQGLEIPVGCGLRPDSLRLVLEEDRLGLMGNLDLPAMDLAACQKHFDSYKDKFDLEEKAGNGTESTPVG